MRLLCNGRHERIVAAPRGSITVNPRVYPPRRDAGNRRGGHQLSAAVDLAHSRNGNCQSSTVWLAQALTLNCPKWTDLVETTGWRLFIAGEPKQNASRAEPTEVMVSELPRRRLRATKLGFMSYGGNGKHEQAVTAASDSLFEIGQSRKSKRSQEAKDTQIRRRPIPVIQRLQKDAPDAHQLRQAKNAPRPRNTSSQPRPQNPPNAKSRNAKKPGKPSPCPRLPADVAADPHESYRNWREVASGETYRAQKPSSWRRG